MTERPDTTVAPQERARSFYQELATHGFSADEVVGLATNLLGLVHGDLATVPSDPDLPAAVSAAAPSDPE